MTLIMALSAVLTVVSTAMPTTVKWDKGQLEQYLEGSRWTPDDLVMKVSTVHHFASMTGRLT
jgi:hypothetical protein